jgi:hypothetical protein
MNDFKLGKVGALDVTAGPSALVCAILMVIALSAVGIFVLKFQILEAVIGGIAATALHYDAELFHQQGHARAALKAGYPMLGIRYWTIFASSIYPSDEPELPAEVHIRRALGGPLNSAIMTAFAGLLVYLTYDPGGLVWSVFMFFSLDNLLVFTLGSLLPLGFTDGSTLLHWLPRRGKVG